MPMVRPWPAPGDKGRLPRGVPPLPPLLPALQRERGGGGDAGGKGRLGHAAGAPRVVQLQGLSWGLRAAFTESRAAGAARFGPAPAPGVPAPAPSS